MSASENSIEHLLNSFRSVCSGLEGAAEVSLMKIKKECKEDCSESEEAIRRFNEITSRIAEVCSELSNSNEALNLAMKQNYSENAIPLPYEMHSDFVRYVNDLYNTMHPAENEPEGKLITEKKQKIIDDLLKLGEKNINELKDIEYALTEAKENLKGAQNMGSENLPINK